MDCKQRSSNVSLNTPTVSRKRFPERRFLVNLAPQHSELIFSSFQKAEIGRKHQWDHVRTRFLQGLGPRWPGTSVETAKLPKSA